MGDPAAGASDRVKLVQTENLLELTLSGRWLLSEGILSSASILPASASTAAVGQVRVDGSNVTAWDSALIAFLADIAQVCRDRGCQLDLSGFPDGVRRLVALALAVPERKDAHREDKAPGFLESIGQPVLDAYRDMGALLEFLGESLIAVTRALTGRARFRLSEIGAVFQQCGPEALPIVTLISFLLGTILGFVGIVQLQQFGADLYVANLVAIAMIREMGGMMTGIIMAGRTGAAFAAQLGTMQVNDEIAAFRSVGISPIEFLVLPRMLALIVAVPLLTIYANVVGMLGGSLVTGALSEVSLVQYYHQTIGAANLVDWAGGLFKATVYGVIVAVAGCLRGMQSSKSAAAVGDAATSAVVLSITLIILAEAVLTVVYQVLGI